MQQHVDLPALDRQHLRLEAVVEQEARTIGERPSPPIGVVADERGADLGREALEPERAGADEAVLEAPGIIGGQDDRVEIVRRHQIGEAAIGRIEVERDRLRIDRARAALGQHAREGRQRDRTVGGIGQAVERRDHVRRGHRPAVVKADALPNLERPHGPVAVRRPAGRQNRLEPQVGAGHREIFPRLRQHADTARIRDGQRVDPRSGHRHADPHDPARPVRRCIVRHGAPARAEKRDRPAEDTCPAQELALVDPAGQKLVDRGIGYRRRAPTKTIEPNVAHADATNRPVPAATPPVSSRRGLYDSVLNITPTKCLKSQM